MWKLLEELYGVVSDVMEINAGNSESHITILAIKFDCGVFLNRKNSTFTNFCL